MKIVNICNRIIEYSFYTLFFFVPLALASDTFELFEFNKMWVTLALTIIIGASWFIKMIVQKQVIFQRTPLDIPIALFLGSQIISTIFSWDSHISFWGYYSRFNGGLLSIVSYIFLYYAFVSNFKNNQARGDASGGVQRRASSFAASARLEGAPLDERAAGPQATSAITIVKRSLFVSLLSGLVVALWGVPSHFGYDPTCLLFRGTLDTTCWTADFQPEVRIFSTLGQPSWLAAYLAILIPISIALFIAEFKTEKGLKLKTKHESGIMNHVLNKNFLLNSLFMILASLFYLDILYTSSKSGFLAIWISLGTFFLSYLLLQRKEIVSLFPKPNKFLFRYWYLLVVFVVLVFITFFVGQPFSQLEKFTFEGIRQSITNSKNIEKVPSDPEPQRFAGALGGTDSGKIRLYVWEGAIDAWKNYPIFGTGVETFAFAYYKFRPVGHNLTSEWNFLYNKAHNEYLNYLATTGAVGLITYLLIIFSFFAYVIRIYTNQNSPNLFGYIRTNVIRMNSDKRGGLPESTQILALGLIAGYISILVTNFFGFSVVITNIYLFLIPAFVFVLTGTLNPTLPDAKRHPASQGDTLQSKTHHVTPWGWTFITLVIIVAIYMLMSLLRFWNADKAYALGSNLNKAGEYQQAYLKLVEAVEKRSGEPVFKDELAVNNAILAAALINQEEISTNSASLANQLAQDAITLNNFITSKYPKNIIFWKSRVRIFYALSQADARYLPDALDAVKNAQSLAPTDANISYNLGVLYGQSNEIEKGIETLKNTIKLKPDYRDAYYALGLFYHDQAVDENGNIVDREKLNKAMEQLQFILENLGEDKIAKETLEQWEKL